MEMTRSILKHMTIPNYLWGEAVRHVTYIINRAATKALNFATPYEVYKGRKPNVAHIRFFGCIEYAKSTKPNVKKLDDRIKVLVHLGTEPGSKAYRMFDPTTQRIIVSRDVVFDETKSWKWSNFDNEEIEKSGMFTFAFGDYGNQGIREDEADGVLENVANEVKLEENREDSEDTEQDDSEDITLRRSTRVTKAPSYLDDYVYLSEI